MNIIPFHPSSTQSSYPVEHSRPAQEPHPQDVTNNYHTEEIQPVQEADPQDVANLFLLAALALLTMAGMLVSAIFSLSLPWTLVALAPAILALLALCVLHMPCVKNGLEEISKEITKLEEQRKKLQKDLDSEIDKTNPQHFDPRVFDRLRIDIGRLSIQIQELKRKRKEIENELKLPSTK